MQKEINGLHAKGVDVHGEGWDGGDHGGIHDLDWEDAGADADSDADINPFAGSLKDEEEDNVRPENFQVLPPSSGASSENTTQMFQSMGKGVALGVAQGHNALHGIRVAIGSKSLAFRGK